jgi:uncharacterized protein
MKRNREKEGFSVFFVKTGKKTGVFLLSYYIACAHAMSRNQYGNLNTIEYIGPRPKKAKKQFFGGWVILVIAAGIAMFFGKPLVASLLQQQVTGNASAASVVIGELKDSDSPSSRLAVAALEIATSPENAKSSSQLLVESYRKGLGIELRKALEDDMASAFEQYPQLWAEARVNEELDGTRLPNYLRFFARSSDDVQHQELQVGDVIFWDMAGSSADDVAHCAIVVPGPSANLGELWIVHSTADGVKWENKIKEFSPVRGRFRYGQ